MDFDQWRVGYDQMTYQDQLAFYDQIEGQYPIQNSFNLAAWCDFFDCLPLADIQVFELGGWHGEMAYALLPHYPHISRWVNWEISRQAVRRSICFDKRYQAIVPDDFAWNLPLPAHNVFVASHTIEHIRLSEAGRLFEKLEARYIGLEMPLLETPPDWSGYNGSHIIEGGWPAVEALLDGYKLFARTEYFRAYET